MADLDVADGMVTARLSRAEQLFALYRAPAVPVSAVESVAVTEAALPGLLDLRRVGLRTTHRVAATYRRPSGRELWIAHDGELVVDVRFTPPGRWARFVVATPDPEQTAAAIRGAGEA